MSETAGTRITSRVHATARAHDGFSCDAVSGVRLGRWSALRSQALEHLNRELIRCVGALSNDVSPACSSRSRIAALDLTSRQPGGPWRSASRFREYDSRESPKARFELHRRADFPPYSCSPRGRLRRTPGRFKPLAASARGEIVCRMVPVPCRCGIDGQSPVHLAQASVCARGTEHSGRDVSFPCQFSRANGERPEHLKRRRSFATRRSWQVFLLMTELLSRRPNLFQRPQWSWAELTRSIRPTLTVCS